MTPATQAKILRAVESGAIERLGGTRPVRIDVRLIAATNQDLTAAIREGRFRQDLYFRIAGVALRLPSLGERREDIPLLVERFWAGLRRKYERTGPELARQVLVRLERAPWPGNVRQLRTAVERYFVLGDMDAALEASPANAQPSAAIDSHDFREAKRLFETEYLKRKLREHGGNVTRTAAIGLERQSLQEKLKQLGIQRAGP